MIWLVGAGNMGQQYVPVLSYLNKEFVTIGRGADTAITFKEATGKEVIQGGIENYLKGNPQIPSAAIVVTPIDHLASNTLQLIEYGVKKILVEKPGATSIEDLIKIREAATHSGASVYIGYNRRFYSSVREAKKRIENDGGVSSFSFEFTEWSQIIEKLDKPKGLLESWLIGNSSHVIDMAFYLGGKPRQLCSFSTGKNELHWHSKGSRFSGAGISETGATFSYNADWTAPGRWALEVCTSSNRYIFRPLEKLMVTPKGTVRIEEIEIDDRLDRDFKPGLYKQVEAFLDDDGERLVSLSQQYKMIETCDQILRGKN